MHAPFQFINSKKKKETHMNNVKIVKVAVGSLKNLFEKRWTSQRMELWKSSVKLLKDKHPKALQEE